LKLDDEDAGAIMLDEIKYFKELGGRTIVENTIHGISRNIKLLKQLSIDSGVNIISGTGT
jgi:phosphotriesterase-related protein